MIDLLEPRHERSDLSWDDLAEALGSFAAATGVCVTAYDEEGVRRVGPFGGAKVLQYFRDAGAMELGSACALIEQELVQAVMLSAAPHQRTLAEHMVVAALPVVVDARVGGVIVYGWVFNTFTTSLGCEQVGRILKVDGVQLWAQARLESPTSVERLSVLTHLLQTLATSAARHAETVCQLKSLARLREIFLAQVSHELRTPLAVLSSRITLLLRGGLDQPAVLREELVKMKAHVSTEARLVEDLIDATRTLTGQLSLKPEPVALAAVLEATRASVAPNAAEKEIALSWPESQELSDIELLVDPHRTQQVFWNLISNSIKFTPAGGRIQLRVKAYSGGCKITVTDSGRGIEPDLLERVFDPFTRAQTGNEHGLGLGLSIARQVVEAHGGKIWVESDGVGEGTSFHVQLPRYVNRRAVRP